MKGTKYASALYKAPHRVAGSAADLVHHVAPLVKASPLERQRIRAERALATVRDTAIGVARGGREVALALREHLPTIARVGATHGAAALEPLEKRATDLIEQIFRPSEHAERVTTPTDSRPGARRLPIVDASA